MNDHYREADLARRITVLDTDVHHATLPERLGAVTAMNMIGHLDRDDRRALWVSLAERLGPVAPIVLNLQPPNSAIVLPDTRFTEIRIGRRAEAAEFGLAVRPVGPASASLFSMRTSG